MGIGGWWKRLRRDREQLTVELAEEGIAPEHEVRAVEERVEHEVEDHGEHTPPEDEQAVSPNN
jgi:hypothetical protein